MSHYKALYKSTATSLYFSLLYTVAVGMEEAKTPFTRYNRLFDDGFDNRLYRVYKHLPGCQTGLTTGFIV